MRSRYTAYVTGAVDYLIATQVAAADRDALVSYCRETMWLGLEIVATERGGTRDDTGIVEFVASGVRGQPFQQHERSRFRRDAGRWIYVDAS